MDKLNPCPFCGCKADFYAQEGRYGYFARAQCNVCGARTRSVKFESSVDMNSPHFWENNSFYQIAELWNTRKE